MDLEVSYRGLVGCLVMDMEVVLSWTFKLPCHGSVSCFLMDMICKLS
jgi:hypothetical protein